MNVFIFLKIAYSEKCVYVILSIVHYNSSVFLNNGVLLSIIDILSTLLIKSSTLKFTLD